MLSDLLRFLKLLFVPYCRRRCEDCAYLRIGRYGYWKNRLRCTAPCGNNRGEPCSAWYPKD